MSYVPPPASAAPGSIPNHLAWAIIATVLATCLCCPLGLVGIVAIVFSPRSTACWRKATSPARSALRPMPRPGAGSPPHWRSSACVINICHVRHGGAESYQQMMEQINSRRSHSHYGRCR